MPEYIAREALLNKAQLAYRIALSEDDINSGKYSGVEFTDNFAVDQDDIVDLPAADVAQVVHGRWMQCKTPLGKIYSVCSNCKTDFKFKTDKGTFARLDMNGMPYCPNCGCKMDKEAQT